MWNLVLSTVFWNPSLYRTVTPKFLVALKREDDIQQFFGGKEQDAYCIRVVYYKQFTNLARNKM